MTGRAVGALRQTLTVTPPPGAAGTAYDLLQRIPARPGKYELRIGVHNTTRHQAGSVQLFVDVPAFDKVSFALSDIGVYAPIGTPAMQGSLADRLLAPPTARRDFDRSERATAFLRLYERGEGFPRPVAVSARVIDDHDRQRFGREGSITAEQFGATNTADFVLELPLADLGGGTYLLTVTATAGGSSARRDVRFTIR